MAETERWEYRVEILQSDSEPHLEFLRQRWPQGFKQQESGLSFLAPAPRGPFPPHTPYALQPQLDAFGEEGWELVTMQPVVIGSNGDVLISRDDRGRLGVWATEYLCTFKKRKSD